MSASSLKRKSIWVLIGWTIVAAIVSYPIYRHNRSVCETSLFAQEGCAAAGSAAPSFWQPFVPIWLIGVVVLAIVYPVVRQRKRLCPICGEDVKRGITVCPACGHDFAGAPGNATRVDASTRAD